MRFSLRAVFLAANVAHTIAKPVPTFPESWSVHEDQYAKVSGTILRWHGRVFNDLTNASHDACTPPGSKNTRSCSATAYVDDDSNGKSTYQFFENNEAIRGLTYFVQGAFVPCYCDMVALGRWLQCENADSLCNQHMVERGKVAPGRFNGTVVDVVSWAETLLIASTRYRLSVQQNTSTPVQYLTTFYEGARTIGYDEVNMTAFVATHPDAAMFAVPKGHFATECADNVCTTYAANRRHGVAPVHAFEGWR